MFSARARCYLKCTCSHDLKTTAPGVCPYSLVDEERLKDALGEVKCPKSKSQLLGECLGLEFASAGDKSSGDKLLA